MQKAAIMIAAFFCPARAWGRGQRAYEKTAACAAVQCYCYSEYCNCCIDCNFNFSFYCYFHSYCYFYFYCYFDRRCRR